MRETVRPQPTARTVLTAFVVLVTGVLALTACSAPSRSAFAKSADSVCAVSARSIDKLNPPEQTGQLWYAVEYFTAYDRLVSQFGKMRLPAADASKLRSQWIDPARRDLQDFRPALNALSDATKSGDQATIAATMTRLRSLGGPGVDTDYLRSLGLTRCSQMFSVQS